MMYVIYNNDGSIKKSNINEYIQQGSNLVNEFAVAIEGYDPAEYNLSATFILPDGTRTTVITSETTTVLDEYEGRKLVLTNAETLLPGTLKMNIQAIADNVVLTSYTVYLQVNEGTSVNSVVLITQQQYENLLQFLESKTVPLYLHRIRFTISSFGPNYFETTILSSSNDVITSWADIANRDLRLAGNPISYNVGFGFLAGQIAYTLYSIGSLTINSWLVDDRDETVEFIVVRGVATFVSDTVIEC